MKRFISLVVLLICFAACQKAPFLTMTGPRSYTFTDQGGKQSFSFSCNRDWRVSSADSWIHVSPSSGTPSDGEITVTITCDANTIYDPRKTTITVKVEELIETIEINQETNLGIIVSPKSYELSNQAQTIEVEIQANVDYTISIDPTCKEWVSKVDTKGLSSQKMSFKIAENETYDNREGKIVVKQTNGSISEDIIIKQRQMDALFVNKTEYDLTYEKQTFEIELDSNIELDVAPEVEWIHYIETKALSHSTIILSVDENDDTKNREAKVVLKQRGGNLSQEIVVRQRAKAFLYATQKEYELSSGNRSSTALTIEVEASATFSISIPADATWITNLGSNTSDRYVYLSIFCNTAPVERETIITLQLLDGSLKEEILIKQRQEPKISVAPLIRFVSKSQQKLEFDVNSNMEFSVSSQCDWISFDSYDSTPGERTIVAIIQENTTGTSRNAEIKIVDTLGDLPRTISVTQFESDMTSIVANGVNAGGLYEYLDLDNLDKIDSLTIQGSINGSDVVLIRRMSSLNYLNLKQTEICSGGDAYYGTSRTVNNQISDNMFFQMKALQTVILPQNCTSISSRAFETDMSINKVVFGDSITYISHFAFLGCTIWNLNLPKTVSSLGNQTFKGCPIRNLFIPASLTYLGANAFNGCDYLETIKFESSTPPTGFPIFYGSTFLYESVVLYVPSGSSSAYKRSSWGEFKNIVEY